MEAKERISPEELAYKLQEILKPSLEGLSIHEIKEVFRIALQTIEYNSAVTFKGEIPSSKYEGCSKV